jgi:drug/metabolite transporter (DMT)-like permease
MAKKALLVVFFVACWYATNIVASYHIKKVFKDVGAPDLQGGVSLAVCISSLQLGLSGLVGYIWYRVNSKNASTTTSAESVLSKTPTDDPWLYLRYAYTHDRSWFNTVVTIGACNCIGCVLTNIGYSRGSVSLVQLIKAMEPAATLVANAVILKSDAGKVHEHRHSAHTCTTHGSQV